MAVALAYSVDEARALVVEASGFNDLDDLHSEPTIHETPIGFVVWGGG